MLSQLKLQMSETVSPLIWVWSCYTSDPGPLSLLMLRVQLPHLKPVVVDSLGDKCWRAFSSESKLRASLDASVQAVSGRGGGRWGHAGRRRGGRMLKAEADARSRTTSTNRSHFLKMTLQLVSSKNVLQFYSFQKKIWEGGAWFFYTHLKKREEKQMADEYTQRWRD